MLLKMNFKAAEVQKLGSGSESVIKHLALELPCLDTVDSK